MARHCAAAWRALKGGEGGGVSGAPLGALPLSDDSSGLWDERGDGWGAICNARGLCRGEDGWWRASLEESDVRLDYARERRRSAVLNTVGDLRRTHIAICAKEEVAFSTHIPTARH